MNNKKPPYYVHLAMNSKPKKSTYHRKLRNFLIDLNKDLLIIDEKMNSMYVYDQYDDLYFYIMALEDRRFLKHGGIDLKSLLREFLRFVSFQKHGGASTIDMQMVRTITDFKEQTFFRKFYEMILAHIVNYRYSKKQIIDCYLEHAFFGSRIIGMQSILRSFEVSSVAQLSDWQKALIAAALQKPKPLNPKDSWKKSISARALYAQEIRSRMMKNSKY